MTTQNPHPAGCADDPAPADRDRAGANPASEPAAGESDTREPAVEPIITARGVRKSFPLGRSDSIEILHGIDLDIYPGEFVAIVGASGSGKSTLLYALSGIDLPTGGTVTIAGQDLAQLSVKQLEEFRLNHIGFIFQQPQLLDGVTLRENALLPAQWHSKPHQQAAAADADRWFCGRAHRSVRLRERGGGVGRVDEITPGWADHSDGDPRCRGGGPGAADYYRDGWCGAGSVGRRKARKLRGLIGSTHLRPQYFRGRLSWRVLLTK